MKKDRGLCIDYRALNQEIIPDMQPIPRVQELHFTLEMATAYHQGYVANNFWKYSVFSRQWGLFKWV